jgi:hypothetical protein
VTEPRYCERCGKEIVRPRYPNGKLQTWPRYAKRRYCSRACSDKAPQPTWFSAQAVDLSDKPFSERALFATFIHLLEAAGDKGAEIGEQVDIDLFLLNARDTICDLMRMPGRVVGGRMEWEVQAP